MISLNSAEIQIGYMYELRYDYLQAKIDELHGEQEMMDHEMSKSNNLNGKTLQLYLLPLTEDEYLEEL